MENMVVLTAKAEKARQEKFNGIDHVVIPVVALVEGVIQGEMAKSPELALASEFGKAPAGWNGRPVTINHPEIRGQKVSANSPEVLETEQIGQLFNTVLDGKKLKTEAWINVARANELGGEIKKTVEQLLKGDIIEVSTGLFSDVEREEGTHDGEKFNGIWRNVIPDHLAVLVKGSIGACSIADGCGANRFNEAGKPTPCENCTCSLKESVSPLASDAKNPDDKGEKSLFERLKHLIGLKANKELSHNSTRNAINAVLASEDGFSFLVDVFSKHVIIEKDGSLFRRNFKITSSGKVKLDKDMTPVRFEASFVDLKMNEEDIMNKDKFVAELIANSASKWEEGDSEFLLTLDEKQLEKVAPALAEVVKNGGGNAELKANAEAEEKTKREEELKKAKSVKINTESVAPVPNTPQTLESYVAAAPTAMQEVLNSGIRAFNSRKTELITSIKANSKNKFTDEVLGTMDLQTLENLSSLAHVEDYTMKGGPRYNEKDPNSIPPSPLVFDLSRKSKSNGISKE